MWPTPPDCRNLKLLGIAFGAAGHLGLDAGVVGGRLNARADKTYLSGLSAQEQKVLGGMSSEQLAEFKQFGDRVSRDASLMDMVANDSREAHDFAARLALRMRDRNAEANLANRTAFAERVSAAHEKGEAISIDIAQDPHNLEMFMRYAEQYGGNSAAAHALMESELARQSLRPNPEPSPTEPHCRLPLEISGTNMCISEEMSRCHPISTASTNPTANKSPGLETPSHRREAHPSYRPFATKFVPTIKSDLVQNRAVQTSVPRPRSSGTMMERLHQGNRYWCSQENRSATTPPQH